jgi:hypothetical protein
MRGCVKEETRVLHKNTDLFRNAAFIYIVCT